MPSARHGAAESITDTLAADAQPLVLVRTVTGLERLAAAELAAAGHRVIDISKRQLIVEPAAASIIADPPRLADDLFVIAADVADPGPTKAHLVALAPVLRRRLAVPSPHLPGEVLSVSASFLGRRTYNRFDIEDLVGEILAERTGARYWSRRTGARPPLRRVDWRVVLDGSRARVAVRPFDAPLHRRDHRAQTVTGSLHPPAAAALARLAQIGPGMRVLDPFCGAGTILLEAHHVQPNAFYTGIDHDAGAIAAARRNADGAQIAWHVEDASHLHPNHAETDRIITNPPWNVRLYLGDLSPHQHQWQRVLRDDGLVVVIVSQHQTRTMIEDSRWQVIEVHDISVAGHHPQIVVARPTR